MLPRFCFILSSCLLWTCSPPSEDFNGAETRKYTDSFKEQTPLPDSIAAIKDPKPIDAHLFDSLVNHFDVNKDIFGTEVYIHKDWRNIWHKEENGIVATVGNGVHLFSSAKLKYDFSVQDSVVFVIGDERFVCRNYSWEMDERIDHCTMFEGEDVYPALEAIAAHYIEPITVEVYDDGKAAHSYLLSAQEKNSLRATAMLADNFVMRVYTRPSE